MHLHLLIWRCQLLGYAYFLGPLLGHLWMLLGLGSPQLEIQNPTVHRTSRHNAQMWTIKMLMKVQRFETVQNIFVKFLPVKRTSRYHVLNCPVKSRAKSSGNWFPLPENILSKIFHLIIKYFFKSKWLSLPEIFNKIIKCICFQINLASFSWNSFFSIIQFDNLFFLK